MADHTGHAGKPWAGHHEAVPVVALAFVVSGVVHLVRPSAFDRLMPPGLPAPRVIISSSGVAELACAVGLLTHRRWAGPASAALLVAVWPGNWYYAVQVQRDDRTTATHKTIAWLRVPLQLPMIRSVLRAR